MLTVAYRELDSGRITTSVNGKGTSRLNRNGDGTRYITRWGSDHILKCDTNIEQSRAEYENWLHVPFKWKKYFAPCVATGKIDDADVRDYIDFDTTNLDLDRWWVLQKRIPILRIDDLRYDLKRAKALRARVAGHNYQEWCRQLEYQKEMITDFAIDLIHTASDWCDGSERQFSIVKGQVMIHDYASGYVRTEESYDRALDEWQRFEDEWGNYEQQGRLNMLTGFEQLKYEDVV